MNFAILTQNAPPRVCGIGDHSLRLADALRACGHQTTILARCGSSAKDVAIIPFDVGAEWMEFVLDRLDRLRPDHVILQYTPLMFSSGNLRIERVLLKCWRALGRERRTSMIVHETYFRVWWRPLSLVRGTLQKVLLRNLVRRSDNVFTASEPLVAEMSGWGPARRPALLPIGSNIPVAAVDIPALRQAYAISDGEIVLTLFGGGTGLKWMAGHVDALEAVLTRADVPHRWLLLGGVPKNWFRFKAPVLDPGRLDWGQLSAHLQLTDIFLMPHAMGVSAKRGTLMAALEHGLSVVGTRGPMTDSFWSSVEGVRLVDAADTGGFAVTVAALCGDRKRRQDHGRRNAACYREQFAWPVIAHRFEDSIASS